MNGNGKLLTASRLLRGRSFLTPLRSNITDGENRYFYYCTVPGEWITLLLRSYLFCMGKYFDMLMEDVRMREGLHSCMNCGVCTGVCPAAEFYNYDPRQIVNIVQTQDDDAIEELMRSDVIWYCGECMSCRPRCPRGNTPAYVIQALRTLSQKLGFFVESEKGRQQLPSSARSGEYPPYGLLCDPETGEARAASRAGYGLGVDLRER